MTGVQAGIAAALAILAAGSGITAPAKSPVLAEASAADNQRVLVLLRLAPDHLGAGPDYGGDSQGWGAGAGARRRVAAGLARRHGLTLVDSWPMPLLGLDCFVMTVPPGRSPAEAAAILARDAGVAWSEPMGVFHAERAAAIPNDPLFAAQPAARAWRLADLHQIATGRNVRVAVIDSKIDLAHPDLIGQVSDARDFAPSHPAFAESHGTEVAGVIAAKANNGLGIAGVAPGARLMGLRACWQLMGPGVLPTLCDSLSLAEALHFAIEDKAQIINLSLSGPPDRLLGALLDVALARGIVIVGAVDGALPGGGFPASHVGVVGVTEESLTPPPFGVYSAPGRDVPTTQPGGRWSLVNGSSFAAAHVSGLFALMRERRPHAGASALVASRSGRGGIDACATLLGVAGRCDCACDRPAELGADARP